jgi:hypothetical protein
MEKACYGLGHAAQGRRKLTCHVFRFSVKQYVWCVEHTGWVCLYAKGAGILTFSFEYFASEFPLSFPLTDDNRLTCDGLFMDTVIQSSVNLPTCHSFFIVEKGGNSSNCYLVSNVHYGYRELCKLVPCHFSKRKKQQKLIYSYLVSNVLCIA